MPQPATNCSSILIAQFHVFLGLLEDGKLTHTGVSTASATAGMLNAEKRNNCGSQCANPIAHGMGTTTQRQNGFRTTEVWVELCFLMPSNQLQLSYSCESLSICSETVFNVLRYEKMVGGCTTAMAWLSWAPLAMLHAWMATEWMFYLSVRVTHTLATEKKPLHSFISNSVHLWYVLLNYLG